MNHPLPPPTMKKFKTQIETIKSSTTKQKQDKYLKKLKNPLTI